MGTPTLVPAKMPCRAMLSLNFASTADPLTGQRPTKDMHAVQFSCDLELGHDGAHVCKFGQHKHREEEVTVSWVYPPPLEEPKNVA